MGRHSTTVTDALNSDAVISHPSWLLIVATLAGLLLGSFLNVCIARLPRHRSVAWPGSHCPRCAVPIRPLDNIPLLSFFRLGGRCRDCKQRISARYPLVEGGLAALFLLSILHFSTPVAFAEAASFCFLMLGLLVMDAETFLLPDAFTLPGIGLGIVQTLLPGGGLLAALHLSSTVPFDLPRWSPTVSSLIGAAGAATSLLAVRWLYRLLRQREGMGLGDVKLAALLGAWLGVAGALLSLVLAVLLAAVAGLVLLCRRQYSNIPLRLPFGSFLCAAGLVTVFIGAHILKWYFSFWL